MEWGNADKLKAFFERCVRKNQISQGSYAISDSETSDLIIGPKGALAPKVP